MDDIVFAIAYAMIKKGLMEPEDILHANDELDNRFGGRTYISILEELRLEAGLEKK